MKSVKPSVKLIVRPQIDTLTLSDYLADIGADDRPAGIVDLNTRFDGEVLVEFAGRLCYRSFKPGLNVNVTKVREDNEVYLNNILSSKHGSVLESSYYVFILANVSRVLTHELVRHRVGVSFSQESGRFVRMTDIPMWIPEWAEKDEALMKNIELYMRHTETFQQWMEEHFDLDNPKANFNKKKAMTSFMRRFAPFGHASNIVFGANIRSLRHTIEMRTSVHSEEEMRLVFKKIYDIMIQEAPVLFGDFVVNENGECVPKYSKV
jgi:thymidylate synthase (FAD)